LRGHGIQILTQVGTHVPSGRRQPDFELRNGGLFYGEGEWQSNYLKGYDQAMEFADIPGCSGFFLLGYPDELRANIRQKRLTTVDPKILLSAKSYRAMFKVEGSRPALFQGRLEQIPEWITNVIEKKARTEHPDEFISLMRDIVSELSNYLPESGEYPSLFEHIIALVPKEKGEIETAKKASAYLLLNQLVFYRILSEAHGYAPIDRTSLKEPRDLKSAYFNKVDDYQAIFDFDVASLFPKKSFKFILDMIKIIDHIQPESFTRDLLGNIFHRLIPEEVRKPIAAYYTNPMAARLLARLSIYTSKDKVADFACGSGTLLMAAYEQKASLLERNFQEHDHRQFIEQDLTGIDVMPFAAHLAVIQLALKNPVYWTDMVRVAVYDSTTIKPGNWMHRLQSVMPRGQTKLSVFANGDSNAIKVNKGSLSPSGSGRGFLLEPVDVVIMNPPFTRKQSINTELRATLNQDFSDYKQYTNNELSYWSYFVLLADRFLKTSGRMALVLPASILRQPTFSGLRKLLNDRYSIRFVVATEYRSAFSESASFREVLLVAEKRNGVKKSAVFASLDVLPNAQNVDDVSSSLLEAFAGDERKLAKYGKCNFVTASDLRTHDDWFRFLPSEKPDLADLTSVTGLSPLLSVVPNMIQGLRLNRQEPEMRPENTMLSYERGERTQIDWKITHEDRLYVYAFNTKKAIDIKIPKVSLVPSTRTATGMDKMLIDHNYDYTVVNRFKGDDAFWNQDNIKEILEGRRRQIETRSAYLIVAGRGGLNLAARGTKLLAFCSPTPIAPTWAFWSMRTNSFEEACLLALWWNSTYMLNQLIEVRTEVEGARVWFGKTALEPLLVIDFHKISKSSKNELLKIFDELSRVPFPSILEQLDNKFEGRLKLDQSLAQALNIQEYTTLDSLAKLYAVTSKKLTSMRLMMGRH
jgi:tRNA1(Val) A37 N6-methylase TrmN6